MKSSDRFVERGLKGGVSDDLSIIMVIVPFNDSLTSSYAHIMEIR
ncbi:MAG: hypothetical protein ACRD4J_13720 [Nitrososphaeraceae archaeon]